MSPGSPAGRAARSWRRSAPSRPTCGRPRTSPAARPPPQKTGPSPCSGISPRIRLRLPLLLPRLPTCCCSSRPRPPPPPWGAAAPAAPEAAAAAAAPQGAAGPRPRQGQQRSPPQVGPAPGLVHGTSELVAPCPNGCRHCPRRADVEEAPASRPSQCPAAAAVAPPADGATLAAASGPGPRCPAMVHRSEAVAPMKAPHEGEARVEVGRRF
mmetsp:Transcript_130719/g.419203  ORF Transcript_130719/g.419203 Transcript_130719/m.419203 type:complete len:211 (-) Transcript_130719:721-1353(-)